MKTEDKALAIDIISQSHSIKVAFNIPVENHYSNVYEILILESNATVLKDLHNAGFSLCMTPKGLSVNKF